MDLNILNLIQVFTLIPVRLDLKISQRNLQKKGLGIQIQKISRTRKGLVSSCATHRGILYNCQKCVNSIDLSMVNICNMMSTYYPGMWKVLHTFYQFDVSFTLCMDIMNEVPL